MTDFLLELRSEEIPARMQEKASADLARLFGGEIGKAGLTASAIETYATPRRLALIARGLPDATQAVREETKGPKASAPPQALEGFLRKTGLTREQLEERDGTLFAIVEKPGRATAEVLAEAIPAIVRAFPWPKAMRWGAASASTSSLRWVRPLQGIVALFGEEVVPFAIEGVESGAATVGHRFHHPGPITIGSAADYAAKLRACHVILDPAERRGIIEGGARAMVEAKGLQVIPDAGLVAENAGLTEWPVPLLGDFDPAFLEVPREVIQLTLRTNQKYFVLADGGGKLAPAFLCTANIEADDGGAAIVAGNRKVLAARLSDARFFWEQDLKVPLEEQAKKLSQIVFHEKLGTVADKVERVAKLARWLVEEGIVGGSSPSGATPPLVSSEVETRSTSKLVVGPSTSLGTNGEGDGAHLAALAETAARLCKADLVTGMVGEFPELQGVMGGYYARAEGLDPQIADAIRDHYKPVGQGDDVPTAPVTVAVSLADKLDSILQFFSVEEMPTGSKDPFALRRAMLGIIAIILSNNLRIGLIRLGTAFDAPFDRPFVHPANTFVRFAIDRLKVQQREAGVRHDLIDAVFALGGEDDFVRLLARVKALQAFVGTEDGANLLAGYKRAANILRKEGVDAPLPGREGSGVGCNPRDASEEDRSRASRPTPSPSVPGKGDELGYAPEPAEAALTSALDDAEVKVAAAVAEERFEDAMSALATLRQPIDAFFDQVTVNDADPAKRIARLALLARIRAACHTVADFSKIEG
ncbi:glycyl-tRNA synthetase beta chain [Sphingomonas vulcanisoli]|uniref:Glycine--tRNA ligase beta subunit n=1 Tax=Sphingomonas vulcanisoli TaxID=1658060 RepID=A0ABX0TPY4_9SPHN|nr:glycine--tRNA ligase subunit beta [Sphingomonas vulcanisoli]NIJ07143.1 glycyl-tRNA synthetase beta chain [Sphingomonas vulcanisoli]